MTNLGNFVWSIADQLRGVYKPHQYGNVILPMTILRRLDCILEPTRADMNRMVQAGERLDLIARRVRDKHKINFFNVTPWDMQKLKADPPNLAANLIDYVHGFSDAIDVFSRFKVRGRDRDHGREGPALPGGLAVRRHQPAPLGTGQRRHG